VTFTPNVQDPLAGIVPPVSVMLVASAAAKSVPVPQDPMGTGGVLTTRPAGKLSVTAVPVSPVDAFGLAMVKLSVVLAPSAMFAAPNVFVMDGGARTVSVAVLLGTPEPLCVEETAPVVLDWTPEVIPVTFTLKVQEPLAATAPAANVMLVAPAAAVMVPLPQEPVGTGGVLTTKPAGKLSVNATPVSGSAVFELVMVKLNVVAPLNGIVVAPKDLAMVGGAATLRLAEAVLPLPPLVDETTPVVLVN